jgi:hypothetical protein
MTNEQKILLADKLIDLVEYFTPEAEQPKRVIGTLKVVYGLNGFKKAELGTPVFEYNGKYLIMLESLNGKTGFEVTFYKDTLMDSIEFN